MRRRMTTAAPRSTERAEPASTEAGLDGLLAAACDRRAGWAVPACGGLKRPGWMGREVYVGVHTRRTVCGFHCGAGAIVLGLHCAGKRGKTASCKLFANLPLNLSGFACIISVLCCCASSRVVAQRHVLPMFVG